MKCNYNKNGDISPNISNINKNSRNFKKAIPWDLLLMHGEIKFLEIKDGRTIKKMENYSEQKFMGIQWGMKNIS